MALTLAVGGIKEKSLAIRPKPQPEPELVPYETEAGAAVPYEQSDAARGRHAPPPMVGRRPPDFSLLGALDKHLFKSRNAPGAQNRSRGVFHPSEIDGCKRYLALDYLVVPAAKTALDARIHRIFENGDGVHYRIQKYLRELADTFGTRAFFKKEMPAKHPDLELDGSTDGVWHIEGHNYLIEIKSINKAGFEKLRKPMAKHVAQVQRYMGATGVQATIMIYECKDNQDWKEYRVDFDASVWQETCRVITYVKETVAAGALPPKEEGSECRGCKFFQDCIKNDLTDAEFFAASRRA